MRVIGKQRVDLRLQRNLWRFRVQGTGPVVRGWIDSIHSVVIDYTPDSWIGSEKPVKPVTISEVTIQIVRDGDVVPNYPMWQYVNSTVFNSEVIHIYWRES